MRSDEDDGDSAVQPPERTAVLRHGVRVADHAFDTFIVDAHNRSVSRHPL